MVKGPIYGKLTSWNMKYVNMKAKVSQAAPVSALPRQNVLYSQ